MATLAHSFLQDLEDLEEDLETSNIETLDTCVKQDFFEDSDEEIPDAIALFEKCQIETVAIVSNLSTQCDFIKQMTDIRNAKETTPVLHTDEDDIKKLHENEYQLIDISNKLMAKLDIEILNIYSFIKDIYSKKFPELASMIYAPLEYIAVAHRIKNEIDLTSVELGDLLPNTVTMAVAVAGSMTTGQPLPPSELEKILKASEEAFHLADCRKDILSYLESRMHILAPNVSAIIGAALAARLITHAGGVSSLARMPSQNIMLIGSSAASLKETGLLGSGSIQTNTAGTSATRSVIYGCDIIQQTPLIIRNRALKLVSGKLGLASRVDSFHEAPDGSVGAALRERIIHSLVKAQEPPPAPLKKSLPIPDDVPKSRRGGKRYRRSKDKYGMSEFKKEANRLAFGPVAEEEIDQEGEGGFGMINTGFGHGKLRLQAKQFKLQAKNLKRQRARIVEGHRSTAAIQQSSGSTGGMSSSLAFTPLQGIELCNPNATIGQRTKTDGRDYFSPAVAFKTE